jgi:hypothetical protein
MSIQFDSNSFGLVCFGAFFLLFFVLLIVGLAYSRKRRLAVNEFARQSGFVAEKSANPEFVEKLREVYAPVQLLRVSNVSKKIEEDKILYLFDVSTRGENMSHNSGSDTSSEQDNIAIESPHLNLPPFMLISRVPIPAFLEAKVENLIDFGIAQMGYTLWQNIPPSFDAGYQLFVKTDPRVESLFTDAVLTKIAGLGALAIRGNGRVLIYKTQQVSQTSRGATDNFQRSVQSVEQLADILSF